MNFFENELRKIVKPGVPFTDPTYLGSACFGTLDENLRVKFQFVTCGTSEHYEALKATIINRNEDPVDSVVIKMSSFVVVFLPLFLCFFQYCIYVFNFQSARIGLVEFEQGFFRFFFALPQLKVNLPIIAVRESSIQ